MTEKQIMSLPKGTSIKVKDKLNCHQDYKHGGILIFQEDSDKSEKEFNFGIKVLFGVCYMFPASAYELGVKQHENTLL